MSPAELENCKAPPWKRSYAKAVTRGGGNRRGDRDATIERHKEEFKASHRGGGIQDFFLARPTASVVRRRSR